MNYVTTQGDKKQESCLYLHFPDEKYLDKFTVSVHSVLLNADQSTPNHIKNEILRILGTLEMKNWELFPTNLLYKQSVDNASDEDMTHYILGIILVYMTST